MWILNYESWMTRFMRNSCALSLQWKATYFILSLCYTNWWCSSTFLFLSCRILIEIWTDLLCQSSTFALHYAVEAIALSFRRVPFANASFYFSGYLSPSESSSLVFLCIKEIIMFCLYLYRQKSMKDDKWPKT